ILQEVRDGDGRQDPDDRHHDHQLDQCEALGLPQLPQSLELVDRLHDTFHDTLLVDLKQDSIADSFVTNSACSPLSGRWTFLSSPVTKQLLCLRSNQLTIH